MNQFPEENIFFRTFDSQHFVSCCTSSHRKPKETRVKSCMTMEWFFVFWTNEKRTNHKPLPQHRCRRTAQCMVVLINNNVSCMHNVQRNIAPLQPMPLDPVWSTGQPASRPADRPATETCRATRNGSINYRLLDAK